MPARSGRVFLTTFVTRRGVFVAFGVKVLSRGFPGKSSDTSVRISSLAVSVAMRLYVALRSVSTVHVTHSRPPFRMAANAASRKTDGAPCGTRSMTPGLTGSVA